eukprot:3937121-Rhodomonas_salina.1
MVRLQKSFLATFTSASAQRSSSLGYIGARVHKVAIRCDMRCICEALPGADEGNAAARSPLHPTT